MMHHPNMHHQPVSGHPQQHLSSHQGMPAHHQMPPHQMHRENRHVTYRVPMGPSGGAGGLSHQPMGGMGSMGMHHAPGQRPPHVRSMHHPPSQHHNVPPQMKGMRRNYGYNQSGPGVVYKPPPTMHHNYKASDTQAVPTTVANERPGNPADIDPATVSANSEVTDSRDDASANSKEKTPMCLVNELARYNKIKHQYRLTTETGPAHKKVFTVTLRLGETEEYTAEGSSIKRAQHAAARAALSGTKFPAPPPRALAQHSTHSHHRNSGAVMPTVELNALCMKLCSPAEYVVVDGGVGGGVAKVRLRMGKRQWVGEGGTAQMARHDAAARALSDLRPSTNNNTTTTSVPVSPENTPDLLNSEVKSPVSLVHELVLKKNLTVVFSVKSERGPPHMRVFTTTCTVGDMSTEGEGNGKKVSKRKAAENMLEEMKKRWPPAMLRPRTNTQVRRKPITGKKKPRNLIKENEPLTQDNSESENPISILAQVRQSFRARSPSYELLEERGAPRKREFVVRCQATPYEANGTGPNKKTAKRRAAQNVLLAMGLGNKLPEGSAPPTANGDITNNEVPIASVDNKKMESETQPTPNGNEVRQPVPGVIMMDYHQRSGQTKQTNGAGADASAASGNNEPSSPGAKEQLMYLSQLLGFTVQFSDFPKRRNHAEYLSLVSLSTSPPIMCHGAGDSIAQSHERSSSAALRALEAMGLDTARAQ